MATTNPMDQAFEEFEKECGGDNTIRREMIEKLRKTMASPEMEISSYDKPMMIQSKLMIVKTLDDLLKSSTDVSVRKLKLKLARKDAETNGAVGTAVVELLKMVHVNEGQNDKVNAAADLEKAKREVEERAKLLAESGDKDALEISEGELEVCSGGPTADHGAEKAAAKAIDKDEEEKE